MVENKDMTETSNIRPFKVAVLGGTGNMGQHFVRQVATNLKRKRKRV